tara:strand:- start:462 stop:692 length:231 start_codon:yes stop_codon:yes gene_type:complete
MLRFINPVAFIVGLSVGLLFVYLSAPAHNVIMVYPTPENVDKLQYRDKAGVCFRFSPVETNCPNDASKIKHIPVQN